MLERILACEYNETRMRMFTEFQLCCHGSALVVSLKRQDTGLIPCPAQRVKGSGTALRQLRFQLRLGSDSWPGNSTGLAAAKKKIILIIIISDWCLAKIQPTSNLPSICWKELPDPFLFIKNRRHGCLHHQLSLACLKSNEKSRCLDKHPCT